MACGAGGRGCAPRVGRARAAVQAAEEHEGRRVMRPARPASCTQTLPGRGFACKGAGLQHGPCRRVHIESSEGQLRGCEGVWPACVLRCGLRPALGLVRGHCAWWSPFFKRMPLGLPICAPVSRGARVRAYALAVMGGLRPRRALMGAYNAAVSLLGGRIWQF